MARQERRKLSEVPILDSRRVIEQDYSYLADSSHGFDPYSIIFDQGAYAISIARAMQTKYSRQYRRFNVGDALMAYNPKRMRTAIFPGATTKLKQTDEKYCAEMQSTDNARHFGYTESVAAFVSGTSSAEKIQGVLGFTVPTLYPCSACAHDFIEPSTVVFSVNDDKNTYEVQTGAHLLDLYDRPKSQEPISMPFHDAQLGLFGLAKAVYLERVAGLGAYSPDTRMEHADAVVYAFREAIE